MELFENRKLQKRHDADLQAVMSENQQFKQQINQFKDLMKAQA